MTSKALAAALLLVLGLAGTRVFAAATGPGAGGAPTPTPSAPPYVVSGVVFESLSGVLRGALVELVPTGRTTMTSLDDGSFAFSGVASGDYAVTVVSPACTPFGCYKPVDVTVADADVVVDIFPNAATPTPPPEPTLEPPGEDEATFTNTSPRAASGLDVQGSPFFGNVSVIDQPASCPAPLYSNMGTVASFSWATSCVRPGDSVTVRATGDCPGCAVVILDEHLWRYDALGDASCNGATNSLDAALLLQRAAALIDHVPCDENADVDGDGAVTPLDAALVLQLDAALLDSLAP